MVDMLQGLLKILNDEFKPLKHEDHGLKIVESDK